MQNNHKICTIFGGSGFVGSNLIRRLTKNDYRIIIPSRSPYLHGHLKPLGNPGHVELVKTNIFDPEEIKKAIKNSSFVINLVGMLHETKKQKFENIHVNFPDILSKICNEQQIKKLIHLSALGVDQKINSKYMWSKLEGENKIKNNFTNSYILRPSIIFGHNDKFFNRFASLAEFSPALPMIGSGKSKFQPVYVGDVADAILKILELEENSQNIFECGGPSVYSFKELMEIMLKEIKKKRLLISIPFGLAKIQGKFLQLLPQPLLTEDQVEILKYDNVLTGQYPNLKDLKISPTKIETVLPKYIYRFRKYGQFG